MPLPKGAWQLRGPVLGTGVRVNPSWAVLGARWESRAGQ